MGKYIERTIYPKELETRVEIAKGGEKPKDMNRLCVAKKFYIMLMETNPDTTKKHSCLGLRGEEATRTADLAGPAGKVTWEE